MGPAAAAIGFLLLFLCVSAVHGRGGLTYTSAHICAVRGSTVDVRRICRLPAKAKRYPIPVEEILWFTEVQDEGEPVDLRTDSEYSGRVKYFCDRTSCTLRITDLRESDSAEYKFRFKNSPKRRSPPGVTVSVTDPDLQVQVRSWYYPWAELLCHSRCHLPERPSFIWYKNGQEVQQEASPSYSDYFDAADSYSCALRRYEAFPAPPVCVFNQTCHKVTYTERSICAFRGSSVDISCSYNSYQTIRSKLWFSPERTDQWQSPSQPEDLSEDSQYAGRLQVFDTEGGRSTLRISDLRDSDSAEYRFRFTTRRFEWRSNLPGTTLTVTALEVQVNRIGVHQSHVEAELRCYSSCSPAGRPSYVWFKNGQKIEEETYSYVEHFDPGDDVSCAFRGHEDSRSDSVYAPKLPSVSVSPSAEIVEGTSVTLTCSSDANPEANYTWYKKNLNLNPLSHEPQLVFRSIQSSDSGEFYCTAENELGRRTSGNISVDVTYAPKLPSVSVSPSAEIVEGTSVTLTCSSDANPAANYTWYKEDGDPDLQPLSEKPQLVFRSIQSSDSGEFYCTAENKLGRRTFGNISVDVTYAPKLPSVSVSPSAEIVEGTSVTLTCSSDANPAASYTWYKEDEDSPKASGQNFTITYVRAAHSGNYSCEAQNRIGLNNSTVHLTVVAITVLQMHPVTVIGKTRSIAIKLTLCLLVLMVVLVLLTQWIGRCHASPVHLLSTLFFRPSDVT